MKDIARRALCLWFGHHIERDVGILWPAGRCRRCGQWVSPAW